jgi:hypothetical protein
MLALVSGPVGIRKEGPPAARSLLYADDIVLPLLASSGIERVFSVLAMSLSEARRPRGSG